jgi:hypothetical protein
MVGQGREGSRPGRVKPSIPEKSFFVALIFFEALAKPPLILVYSPPWITKLSRLVHASVVSSDSAFSALDDEEVLHSPWVFLLPEALLVDLLRYRVGKPVAVVLAHRDNRPVTAAEAIGGGFLTVAKETVEVRLERHGKLAKALVEVLLICLRFSEKQARSEPTFIGGMIIVDIGEAHVAQLLLAVGLGARDHEGLLFIM